MGVSAPILTGSGKTRSWMYDYSESESLCRPVAHRMDGDVGSGLHRYGYARPLHVRKGWPGQFSVKLGSQRPGKTRGQPDSFKVFYISGNSGFGCRCFCRRGQALQIPGNSGLGGRCLGRQAFQIPGDSRFRRWPPCNSRGFIPNFRSFGCGPPAAPEDESGQGKGD
jgi:hypothetical protein